MIENKNDNQVNKLSSPVFGVIVRRGQNDEIPQNAVKLNLHSIVEIQRARLRTWVPQEDVWSFRNSSKLVAVFTGLTSSITVLYVRRFFQLHAQKIPTTFFPAVIVPLFLTGFMSEVYINVPLLQGIRNCSLCMELRGSVIQVQSVL